MKNYSFTNTVIVRNPIQDKQLDLSWEKIVALFSEKAHREALFLGSPTVYDTLVAWEKGANTLETIAIEKLKITLYKYASRLANRATPFGMFATVAAATISANSALAVQNSILGRHTKLDMFFLGSLLPIITKNEDIRSVLQYYPNNSLYEVVDKYRYVEYYFKDNVRFHKISEVEKTEYLEAVLTISRKGTSIKALIELLVDEEVTVEEAKEFIDTLIENQFIVSELEFTVTGKDYLEKLIDTFREERFAFYEATVISKLITTLKEKITALDTNGTNTSDVYLEIYNLLRNQIGNEVDIAKLFQVDSYRKMTGSVSFKTLKSLRSAITALNKLQSSPENATLKEFKKRFLERYEEYEQPLAAVLDPDIGLGYAKQTGAKTPLLDNLAVMPHKQEEKQLFFDNKKTFLLKKLWVALQNNATVIEITDEELKDFQENELLYPDTFSVFTNIFTEAGNEKINLKSVSGTSANALIGRFTHLDANILALANEISNLESQLNPDKIIAEIVHLPQARTGNILYRNFQRDYEIPYLGNASVHQEHQIQIDDLYVSVRNNKVVLRSKRLNKEVIPRLSNAHNYSANALPIYHFLCDIQNQDTFGLKFSWGPLQAEFDFLPRVQYKDVLFARATWNIKKQDIETILTTEESKIVEVVRAYQKKRKIPNLIYSTQGDNEVLINFDNALSCKVFYSMLKGKNFLQLKEFLFEEESITGNYCNEIILSAHRNVPITIATSITDFTSEEIPDVKESFSIGDDWLYYKFYCGERAGEEVLTRIINPLVGELYHKNLITKWFFIRYNDTLGHHIRFRILLNNLNNFTDCIQLVKKYTTEFEKSKVIWKVQTDSYLRELQRYGHYAIEATESLFHYDSFCTLQFTAMIEGDSGEKVRWLFAMLSIDHLMNDFNISLEDCVKLFNAAKTSFGKEFNRSGKLNKDINTLFADNELEIERFLDKNNIEEMYEPLLQILAVRSQNNIPVIEVLQKFDAQNKLPRPLHEVLLSYVHMICNRIFLSQHRRHEMVVYDFMYKYYKKRSYLTPITC
ncbi:lantibiotic dehydratase [Flavobacterium davisii]|uniref:lantibiotic dehydratase n=1 Tax=Flavobacterium davisii TaxID=2906077 RepID=UPI0035D0D887